MHARRPSQRRRSRHGSGVDVQGASTGPTLHRTHGAYIKQELTCHRKTREKQVSDDAAATAAALTYRGGQHWPDFAPHPRCGHLARAEFARAERISDDNSRSGIDVQEADTGPTLHRTHGADI